MGGQILRRIGTIWNDSGTIPGIGVCLPGIKLRFRAGLSEFEGMPSETDPRQMEDTSGYSMLVVRPLFARSSNHDGARRREGKEMVVSEHSQTEAGPKKHRSQTEEIPKRAEERAKK